MSSQPLLQTAPGTQAPSSSSPNVQRGFAPQESAFPRLSRRAIGVPSSTYVVDRAVEYMRQIKEQRTREAAAEEGHAVSVGAPGHASARDPRYASDEQHPPRTDGACSPSRRSRSTVEGKRISLPVRVEPKVFFANERTFLSWLNFSVILGGLAIGLLNFGDKIGQISAGLFTLVAMAAMVYALGVFHWRAGRIRRRGAAGGAGGSGVGGFDDRFGPTVLTLALAAAVIVNFVLRVVGGENAKGGDGGVPRRPDVVVQELR